MSSKYLTILLAVAAILLTNSCSSDDMDNILAESSVSAQVTASISNGNTATRISNTSTTAASFTQDDIINVVADETTYQYTKQSTGSWSSTTPYYFTSTSSVSFMGWYAYPDVTVSENTISIDTSTQTTNSDDGWNNWDILVTPEVSASAASPTISFTDDNAFQHIMSKMTFTFVAAGGLSDLSLLTGYGLRELVTSATFNTQSCTLTNGTSKVSISKDITSSSATSVTCDPIILLPQTLTNGKFTLDVTYNEKVFSAELSLPEDATALEAGTHYTYTLTITGLEVVSAEIADWNTSSEEKDATLNYTFTTDESTGTRSYTVYTEAGLNAWATYVNNGNWDANCTLASNITMESESYWTPIGEQSDDGTDNPYTGTFDGAGKTITNLTVSADYNSNLGLIGYLGEGGEVKDLTLVNANLYSAYGWGLGAVVGTSYGTVSNCSATGTISGAGQVGGVVGKNYSNITGCYFSGTVEGIDDSYSGSGPQIGGVVGVNYNGSVSECYSTGTVSGTYNVGGVVGHNSAGTITACYSSASVIGAAGSYWNTSTSGYADNAGGYYIGGVVGTNEWSTIIACYSTGTVSGTAGYIGGVAGNNINYGSLTACYSSGTISASGSYIGGVVGNLEADYVDNVTYDGSVSTCYWYNSNTSYGIGSSSSNDGATQVSDSDWSSAATAMNSALTSYGWEYVTGTDSPLILQSTSN